MIIAILIHVILLCMCLFYRPKWLLLLLSIGFAAYYFELSQDNYLIFIIYLLGILMLIIELYIPDFGIIGSLGFLVTIFSLYIQISDLQQLILTVLAIIVTAFIAISLPLKMGSNLSIGPGFVLKTAMNKEAGYSSHKDLSYLVGQEGIVSSSLRPVGRAKFQDDYYEVMSIEDMIHQGEKIFVDRVDGSRIYVRKGEK